MFPAAAMSPAAAASPVIGASPAAGAPAADARPQRNLRRAAVITALLLAGLGGLGGGGYGLFHELTRGPTHAELARAGNAEQAQRWRELPVGKIFPAAIPYTTDAIPYTTIAGTAEQAHLVGVLPAGDCSSAVDPATAPVLAAHGCRSMLRATYADLSGTVLVTIGVAVMPGTAAAGSASGALPLGHGVLPAGFAGTIASRFGGDKHLAYDSSSGVGPYLIMAALGYADGRAAPEMPDAVRDLASELETRVTDTLDASVPPCRAKDVRC